MPQSTTCNAEKQDTQSQTSFNFWLKMSTELMDKSLNSLEHGFELSLDIVTKEKFECINVLLIFLSLTTKIPFYNNLSVKDQDSKAFLARETFKGLTLLKVKHKSFGLPKFLEVRN